MFVHPEQGPLVGSLLVSPMSEGFWRTEWDIGTIDQDPQLSDSWFCREQYDKKFAQVLQTALNKSDSVCFGATSRWGTAKGLRQKSALDLARKVVGLWEEILADWEARDNDYFI
jgi:hypothetical protein